MEIFLILTFLFAVGALCGWVLELFFRRFNSKKWINPGFLHGPYLPLYGFGLALLFLIARIPLGGISAVWLRYVVLLAVICAVPLGIMSSENIAPWWICQPVRRLMDAARAINEMVFAMMFVVAVGLGPFAGVLALWVHTTGTLAKLFSEAVEAIEVSPVEGVRSTGASFLEEIIFGVIPQVFPLWISYSLYRFEANVRSATVVGMVGAGGIGMVLWELFRSFNFQQTCAVMAIIVLVVTLFDLLSQRLRMMVL